MTAASAVTVLSQSPARRHAARPGIAWCRPCCARAISARRTASRPSGSGTHWLAARNSRAVSRSSAISGSTTVDPSAPLGALRPSSPRSRVSSWTSSGGSVISGGRVQKSVIGNDVRVNSYCEVADSIIYNHVNIGRHSRIRRAIIDRHVSLPERTEIGYDTEADRQRYHVTDSGIVIVVRQESLIEEPESA